ncbi:MAG: prepilin peptidase [Candidatus Nomurabacteria bacterium]|jgi:prepilin signal peptidase PulO-like enzyme (type II secretory pathway)|nr:prepilin peptidase [Candidatus Nomurabacteria bacterium]
MEIFLATVLFILGAVFGSFACCQAYRIHKGREKLLKQAPSHCLKCHKRLEPVELIPILSWIVQKGRCKKCHEPIGSAEILAEIGLGLAFLLSYLFFPFPLTTTLEVVRFAVFLLVLVPLAVIFIYDLKWGLLPTKLIALSVICATVFWVLSSESLFSTAKILSLLGSIGILSGIYYLLYFFSKEKLVGAGDWLLALPLAIMLGDVWLAFFALFAANLIGCLVTVPLLACKKLKNPRIPFGPFLISGFLIVFLIQNWLLSLIIF